MRHHVHLIFDANDATLHPFYDALVLFLDDLSEQLSGNKGAIYFTHDLFGATPQTASYSWRGVNSCDVCLVLIGQSYGALSNTGVSQLHISYLNAKTRSKPLLVFATNSTTRPRQLIDLLGVIEPQQAVYPLISATAFTRELKKLYPDTQEFFVKKPDAPLLRTPKNAVIKPDTSAGAAPIALELKTAINLNCTAHAFSGGALIEVAFMATTNWEAILSAILLTNMAFSTQGLWRIVNDLVAAQAMPAVKAKHPNVHAISRCQVSKADLLWLQNELIKAALIEKPPSTQKDAWRLSARARALL